MKILLTGGTGRLGTELQKLRTYDYAPSHAEMDVTDEVSVWKYLSRTRESAKEHFGINLIVHCAAYTRVEAAEHNQFEAWNTNVVGTETLAALGIPILYISTEYVFHGDKGLYTEEDFPLPVNFYAMSKLVGEWRLNKERDKILRLIFKPRPWPFPVAFCDQWTSGDYTDVIAKEVDKAITLFRALPRVTHIGTERKSMYELAQQTRSVTPNSRSDVLVKVPRDCSLDLSQWTRLKMESGL